MKSTQVNLPHGYSISGPDPTEATTRPTPRRTCRHDVIESGVAISECRLCGMRMEWRAMQWYEAPLPGEVYKKPDLTPKHIGYSAYTPSVTGGLVQSTGKPKLKDLTPAEQARVILKLLGSAEDKVPIAEREKLVRFLVAEDQRKKMARMEKKVKKLDAKLKGARP